MNILVTGGGGFLGSAIVRLLREQGKEVRSFSRGQYPELERLGVACLRGDVADGEALMRAADGCDIVYHTAALPGIAGRYEDYFRTNVIGTRNVIAACRRHGVGKLVHTSSPSVVFDGADMEGAVESVPYPAHYEAHYPETKAIAEREVLAANGPGLATVALRPHLIWGPGDNHLVPRIINRARAGKLRRIGKRHCLIDTVYIDNAAKAHLLAAAALAPDSAVAGQTYFISNGEPLEVWEIVNRFLDAAGVPPVEKSVPYPLALATGAVLERLWELLRLGGEPPLTRFLVRELASSHWFDISAAERDFGYRPEISIDEGIERLRGWLRKSANAI